jgi:1,4-dihydroxy-6-naphthoate synthase
LFDGQGVNVDAFLRMTLSATDATKRTLSMAYSPCPNDTFMFHAVASGELAGKDFGFAVHLHDVETLNRLALESRYDVTKISFHAWLLARQHYRLLGAGAALGHGNGPLLVARHAMMPGDWAACRIAVPGELTTAHLLLRLRAPEARQKIFVPYDRVLDMVLSGEADCGVLIHETRFVYRERGLTCLADLGEWWESRTGHPIPLGCIVAHRRLGDAMTGDVEELLRDSIHRALANPAATDAYVRDNARETDPSVVERHIRMFVNEFSLDLGAEGRAAIAALESMAREAGIIR